MKVNNMLSLLLSSTMIFGSIFSVSANEINYSNENINSTIKAPRAFTKVYSPYISKEYLPVMYDSNTFPNDDTIRIIFDEGADSNKKESINIRVTEYMAVGDDVIHTVTISEGSSAKIQLEKPGNNFGMEASGNTEGRIKISVTLGSQ